MAKMVVGIAFYKREQWPLLVEDAADSHVLEKTYDAWLDVVDESIEKIEAHGIEPKLVDVDIADLISFCRQQGLQNTASARSQYIGKLLREKVSSI